LIATLSAIAPALPIAAAAFAAVAARARAKIATRGAGITPCHTPFSFHRHYFRHFRFFDIDADFILISAIFGHFMPRHFHGFSLDFELLMPDYCYADFTPFSLFD